MSPERLRSPAAIRSAVTSGRAQHRTNLVVHARTREDPGPARAAVVAGRKVGGAVRRNRAKRRLRSALARTAPPSGFDLVVVARAGAVTCPWDELVEELRSALDAVRQAHS